MNFGLVIATLDRTINVVGVGTLLTTWMPRDSSFALRIVTLLPASKP